MQQWLPEVLPAQLWSSVHAPGITQTFCWQTMSVAGHWSLRTH